MLLFYDSLCIQQNYYKFAAYYNSFIVFWYKQQFLIKAQNMQEF